MAQRRSRNRRLSARRSNVSGYLNDDTNAYDNNDPLWFDRTVVRPSTSLQLSKNTTATLDPDSTVHASQLSDNWFVNLSQSDNSKQLQEAVKNKRSKHDEATDQADSDQRSAATESESEQEFQKKRANLRSIRKPSHKINNSNAFMKALEKTTDSHTRNLTHGQMLEGNESESTHDDSRTIKKLRPRFTKRAKNDTNNFDKALESDSASEKPDTSRRSLRSRKRISEANEEYATPEKQKRLTRSTAEKVVNASHGTRSVEKLQNRSANKSTDKTIIAETSVRELRNRNVVTSSTKSAKPVRESSSFKKPSKDQSPDASSSNLEVRRHKRQLFSQGNKSTAEKSKEDKNAFDAILDSVIDSQEQEVVIVETASTSKGNEQDNTQEDDNDSDSSSIPQNIRRTRSRSLFGERNSGANEASNAGKNKSRAQDKDSSKSALSVRPNQSNSLDKAQNIRDTLTAESSDDEDIYNGSITKSRVAEKKSTKSPTVNSQISSIEIEGSSSEDIIDPSLSKTKSSETNKDDKTKSSQLQVSSIETSDEEHIINVSALRIKQKEAEVSKKADKSLEKASESRKSKSTLSGDASTSPEVSNRKSRSRLFQKKNVSKDGIAFDQISFNKTKEKEIEDTPRLSQRSSPSGVKCHKSQNDQSANASKNKSNSRESSKNDSKADQSEDETSTIPRNIRRTRSRLFQKLQSGDDDNAFEGASNVENTPHNRSELSEKSKASRKSANKSASMMRDAELNRSALEAIRKGSKPKIIGDKVVRPADSVDPLVESRNRQSSPRQSAANRSLNAEKQPVSNSQDGSSDHRSVETSSDGTPAPVSPKQASTPFAPPVLPSKPPKRKSLAADSAKSGQNSTYDDLLHTPNPAQSTLNPQGKPFNRITQFSFRTFADLEERTPPAPGRPGPRPIPEDHDDVDVTGESDVSDCPLISRRADEIPQDKENTIQVDSALPVASKSLEKKQQIASSSMNNNTEEESNIDWEKVKQHTDAVKVMMETQMRLAEEARKKRECEKQRIDEKVKRLQAQRAAELKRKNKPPVHKAFLVNGKVYKQPRLPWTKSWVTNKLYHFLWKRMEPKYNRRTRVKSEEFVLKLSDFATRIAKLKKFESYRSELDDIMLTMANLGIIKTRYDFYRFAVDFMPYDFRIKVNPMMMPGNERNIPYDPELVHRPLLAESTTSQESETDES